MSVLILISTMAGMALISMIIGKIVDDDMNEDSNHRHHHMR